MADLSQLNVNNTDYNLKDAAARNDIQSTQTVSGNPITLTDCAPINAESLVVKLEPKQEGSGDPSPTNIRPITGYTECEVDDVGVNQWDEEWELGSLNMDTGAKANANNLIRSKNFIPIKSNTNYFFKYFAPELSNTNFYICFYDNNKQFLSSVSAHDTVTTPLNAYFMLFRCHSNYGTTYNHDISINYPSTYTEYEPYHSSNAIIQFGQTIYGGKSDFVKGGTSAEITCIEMDTLSWTYNTSYSHNVFTATLSDSETFEATSKLVCSQYKQSEQNSSSNSSTIGYMSDGDIQIKRSSKQIFVYDSRYTDAATFTTAMDGVQLCYKLATPTTISTPPTALKLLQGTNNITTNGTTINLGYQPDNVIGELKGMIQDLWDYVLSQGE